MADRGTKQVAALCWRKHKGRMEVLLITSRETRRWVIPKGWPMDGLKDYNAARLEAFEEAGVEGRMTRKSIGHFVYDKLHATQGSKSLKVDVYSLEAKVLLGSWPEKKQRKRQWFSVQDAVECVREPELRQVISRFAGL